MKVGNITVLCLSLLMLLAACSKDQKVTDPGQTDGEWQYGTTRTYDADPLPGSTITDTVTGTTLRFPEGGIGTVHISQITEAPDTPGEGTGLKIEYDGVDPVFLEVDTTAGEYATVYGYGHVSGAFDDETGNGLRWASLPREEVNGDVISFILMFPQALGKTTAAAQNQVGFNNYWINKNTATTGQVEQRVNIGLQVRTFVDQCLGILPEPLRSTVTTKVQSTHRYRVDFDGNYYSGFWWRSLGSYGRILKPTIHVKLPATAGTVAHETSHYLAHVLTTDDVQSALEGQGGFFDNHGLRENVGRDVILEEYAYFGEYYFTGTGGNYNLAEPYDVFRNMTSLTADFPSLEGFGAVLLAGLVRTTGTIRDIITGNQVNIPVIGLSYAQVFEIISRGALGIEQLRTNIETTPGVDKKKLDGLLQRIGWSYSIQGRLVDENDAPVPGAYVSNLLSIGSDVYDGGFSSIPSDAAGAFRILGQVFPGSSTLRVIIGTDTTDVDITLAYTNRTDQTVNVGDIRVEGLLARMKRTTQLYAGLKCGLPHSWSWYNSTSGNSGQYTQSTYSWEISAGIWAQEPDLSWNNTGFTFQFVGSREGHIFAPAQAGSLPMSDWVTEISGTVDKTGKLLSATLTVLRIDQEFSVGKVENVEITLNNIEPTYIEPRGDAVSVTWQVTKDDVANHLNIVKAEVNYGSQTDTYLSTDWQNGYECYWNTPMDVVFYMEVKP